MNRILINVLSGVHLQEEGWVIMPMKVVPINVLTKIVAFDIPPCALPLSLINFTANAGINKVNLSWTTASETNTKEFVVEYAADNSNWKAMGV